MVIQSPIYEIFKIVSADGQTEVSIDDAQFRVTDISYYENILSPNITGKVTIFSTIGAVKSASDTQNRLGSLYSSLPLEVGCEILMKIKDTIGNGLDFSSKNEIYLNSFS